MTGLVAWWRNMLGTAVMEQPADDQPVGPEAQASDTRLGSSSEAKEETVAELLESVRGILDDERARGRSLDTKTSTLAGFSGAILAVVATLGRELFKLNLGAVGNTAVEVLFLASVLALAAAVMMFVGGILRPQPRLAIATEQIRAFARPPLIFEEKLKIQGNMLATLGEALARERQINDRKARLSTYAGGALLVGVAGVGAQALVLALHELGL